MRQALPRRGPQKTEPSPDWPELQEPKERAAPDAGAPSRPRPIFLMPAPHGPGRSSAPGLRLAVGRRRLKHTTREKPEIGSPRGNSLTWLPLPEESNSPTI